MAQTKRSSNTQKEKATNGSAGKGASAKKSTATSSAKGAKGAKGAKAAAPSTSGTARRTGSSRRSQEEQPREAVQDSVPAEGARGTTVQRSDILGIVLGACGIALLIAVLTPTSGILTEAVSGALRSLLGLCAPLFPIALVVGAVGCFVNIRGLVPARVLIGLGLILLSAMGILGILTQGCVEDPSLLFNPYVLKDRGGYIGNGMAWALVTLVGQPAGVVLLVALAIAGLVVLGLNFKELFARLAQRISLAIDDLSQKRERSKAAASNQQAGWNAVRTNGQFPQGYEPTALFNPGDRPRTAANDGAAQAYDQAAQNAVPMANAGVYGDVAANGPSYSAPAYGAPTYNGAAYSGAAANPYTDSVIRTPGSYGLPQEHDAYAEGALDRVNAPIDGADRIQPPAQLEMEFPATVQENTFDPAAQGHGFAGQAEPFAPVEPLPYAEPVMQGAVGMGPVSASIPSVAKRHERDARKKKRAQESVWWDTDRPDDAEGFDALDGGMDELNPSLGPKIGELAGVSLHFDDITRQAGDDAEGVDDADEGGSAVLCGDVEGSDVPDEPATEALAAAEPASANVPFEFSTPDQGASTPAAASKAKSGRALKQPSSPAGKAAQTEQPAGPEDGGEAEEPRPYILPDPSIMRRNKQGIQKTPEQKLEIEKMAGQLQDTLSEFNVKSSVVDWVEGPTCTTFEVVPGEGVRVNKFTSLEDDIARKLAKESVRIYAPVPGTSYVGIDVPNNTRQMVFFGDVFPCVKGGPLDLAVGLDSRGNPSHVDLAKLPHLLIAGSTGSGKSVMMNTIIISMLMRCTPDEVRLIMVDPKQVELSGYNGIPHLIMPVVSDMRQAAAALQWGVTEMDRRYKVFSNQMVGARDLDTYNQMVADGKFADCEFPLTRLPRVVIIIDELTDLMMVAKKDVEASIVRIAQLGRACGIHLVMATQRPSANVVTGLIKANIANRIAFKVASGIDSKVILDQTGAEKLLGNGDMLFLQTSVGDKPRRLQGCYLSDDEILQVVNHLKQQPPAASSCGMAPLPGVQMVADLNGGDMVPTVAQSDGGQTDDDPLAWEAAKLVVDTQLGSTSMLQRRLKLGYARAGRVMDMLEEMGVVGPAHGSKPREVLIHDLDELETLRQFSAETEEDY